jgi:aminoglycoside 6'-N-acetyltransferase I
VREIDALMSIEVCMADALDDWLRLRLLLWPEASEDKHRRYMSEMLERPDKHHVLIARSSSGDVVAFAEASLRHDYVNGCDSSPVVFLKGIFVMPEHRRRGLARSLCAQVSEWGASNRCVEFASDAPVENHESHAMHRALGFEEMERVVYFRKAITTDTTGNA